MATASAQAAPQIHPAAADHQEGARWIGNPPEAKEFADWFEKNVKVHGDLKHSDYVGGITLITGTEKVKRPHIDTGQIMEIQRLVHTPYPKVETRVTYWWDWIAMHDDWLGLIEPVDVPTVKEPGYNNENLPPGFFRHPVKMPTGNGFVNYVGCAMQAHILKADTVERVQSGGGVHKKVRYIGLPVAVFPPATKLAPVLEYGKVDPYALMKAETGAVGRALGMAGMLVIPGSGVATAEDMQELQAGPPAAQPAEGGEEGGDGALPADTPPADTEAQEKQAGEGTLREQIAELAVKVEQDKPGEFEKIVAWAKEKKIDLTDLKEHQLRGVLRKLEQAMEA